MSGMDDVARGWLQHRMVLQELLELVDNEHIDFKPWDGAYTLSELAVHIITSMDMYVNAIKNGEFQKQEAITDYDTIDDLRKIIHAHTEKTKEEVKAIFDFQLKTNLQYGKIKAPGTYWLSNAIDHEIHYKGLFFSYIHLIGVKKVPFFMKQPFEV